MQFQDQSNYYAVYSRPVENVANFFAVCELKKFFYRKIQKNTKIQKMRMKT